MTRRLVGELAAGIAEVRVGGGLVTEAWGWQPTAWLEDGLPTWRWRCAPRGLLTRRQMRAAGLAPGGSRPVARVVCRRGRRWAGLWDRSALVPKRTPSSAQLEALARALAARRWCPSCRRDVGYCVPRSIGRCGRCHVHEGNDGGGEGRG